jgi:hypothetical protein
MNNIMSIEFYYKEQPYYALISTKMTEGKKSYYVSILNGDPEKMLYCQNIVVDEDGSIRAQEEISSSELTEFKESITVMLWQRLQENATAN